MNEKFLNGNLDTALLWPAELFDVTHPHDAGYAEYADLFFKEWERIENAPEKEPSLPDDFICGKNFSNIKRVDLADLKPSGWQVSYPCCVSDCYDWLTSRFVDKLVMYSNAERISQSNWQNNGKKLEPFTFKVKAQRVAAMIETLPESVKFSVSVDGNEPQEIKFRSVYRSQFHIVLLANELEPGKWHTIKVIPESPADDKPGVMRWGAILLNSSDEVELEF